MRKSIQAEETGSAKALSVCPKCPKISKKAKCKEMRSERKPGHIG